MKIISSMFATGFALCLLAKASYSQHNHAHAVGPNGGPVTGLGEDNHVEGIVADTAAGVYILDASESPKSSKVKSHGGGLLTVVPKSGKVINKKIPAGSNLSEVFADIPKGTKIKEIKLKLKIGGKDQKASFKF